MKKIFLAAVALAATLCANADRIVIDGIIYNLTLTSGSEPVRTAVIKGTHGEQKIVDLVIPESVEYRSVSYPVIEINNDVFKNYLTLESVTLPGSIAKIGENAFSGCVNLKSVMISEGVEKLGDRIFEQCIALEEVKLPESVSIIGESAFSGCVNLKSIVIPEGVKELGYDFFMNCESLETADVRGVTDFGSCCFANCLSLKNILFAQDKTLSFGAGCFQNNVWVPEELELNVRGLSLGCFEGCTALKKIILNNEVEGYVYLEGNIFGDDNNVEYVTVNADRVYMPLWHMEPFTGCHKLKDISFSGSLKFTAYATSRSGGGSIYDHYFDEKDENFYDDNLVLDMIKYSLLDPAYLDRNHFDGCESLKHIGFLSQFDIQEPRGMSDIWMTGAQRKLGLPGGEIYLGDNWGYTYLFDGAFDGDGITAIHCNGAMPPSLVKYVADKGLVEDAEADPMGVDRTVCPLYVPAGRSEYYKEHPYWGGFARIIEDENVKVDPVEPADPDTRRASDGVEQVSADTPELSAPVYYNIQGVQVERPARGLYIKVTGSRAEKVAF